MKIAKETWIILCIGLADLATTIVFIQNHGAQEANPLFRLYWEMGLTVFIMAKIAMLVGPLYVLEWARKRNPRFVDWALRGAIVAYLIMYGVGFAKLNVHPEIRETASISTPLNVPMVRNHRHYVRSNSVRETDSPDSVEQVSVY